jgi:2,4-dienoyl-CoA reductase-like NADH-dependent reductase (Old Yellow Enzyme family)
MRLVLDIAEAVRSRVRPSFVLGIKLNSIEFQDSGITPEEAGKVCEALEKGGLTLSS